MPIILGIGRRGELVYAKSFKDLQAMTRENSKPRTKKQQEKLDKYKSVRFKSGEKCPVSGQYTLSDGTQATVTYREPFPPTPRPRMTWKLTDVTR